jgi:hypothetical protein
LSSSPALAVAGAAVVASGVVLVGVGVIGVWWCGSSLVVMCGDVTS